MVHRDIKPSNLMLTREGDRAVIKVLDFGLAKVRSEGRTDGTLTHEGQMLGTPDYIAPEQIRDAQRADIRADIYSLGCTLYYLLTGGPPFQGRASTTSSRRTSQWTPMPLNLVRPEVPVELAALVAKMMAKEPERRFQTPKEVAQALAPFFKKGDIALKSAGVELSQAGQPGSGRPVPGLDPLRRLLQRRTDAAGLLARTRKGAGAVGTCDGVEELDRCGGNGAIPATKRQPSNQAGGLHGYWPSVAVGDAAPRVFSSHSAQCIRRSTPRRGRSSLQDSPRTADRPRRRRAKSTSPGQDGGKPAGDLGRCPVLARDTRCRRTDSNCVRRRGHRQIKGARSHSRCGSSRLPESRPTNVATDDRTASLHSFTKADVGTYDPGARDKADSRSHRRTQSRSGVAAKKPEPNSKYRSVVEPEFVTTRVGSDQAQADSGGHFSHGLGR